MIGVEELIALTERAARECVPVEPTVSVERDRELWTATVRDGHGTVITRCSYASDREALLRAARAMLARESAEGPACEELRGVVSDE